MDKTYFRDDSGYRRNNGLAAWGLLAIPFFLLLVGLGFYNYFAARSTTNTTSVYPTGKPLFGIGGGPPTATVKPSNTPVPSRKPTVTVTPKITDETQQSKTELGVGGGAPPAGGGGTYEK